MVPTAKPTAATTPEIPTGETFRETNTLYWMEYNAGCCQDLRQWPPPAPFRR